MVKLFYRWFSANPKSWSNTGVFSDYSNSQLAFPFCSSMLKKSLTQERIYQSQTTVKKIYVVYDLSVAWVNVHSAL